jgi:hypothetical protein
MKPSRDLSRGTDLVPQIIATTDRCMADKPDCWGPSAYVSNKFGLDDSEIPAQRRTSLRSIYNTKSFCMLSDDEADISCSEMGPEKLLAKLNTAMKTSLSLSDCEPVLLHCIEQNYDFGMAYSFVRPWWHKLPRRKKYSPRNVVSQQEQVSTFLTRLARSEREDGDMRAAALKEDFVKKDTPPRRLWDLLSNRVIPYWMVVGYYVSEAMRAYTLPFWAISHNWLHEDRRHNLLTPVNGYQWPVPIPRDSSLARVRIELMNQGGIPHSGKSLYGHLAYAWLDVLCLRQHTSSKECEAARIQEWRLDVPTVGEIYKKAHHVYYYMNGLGLPFLLGDLDNDRHWINRVWTLQETAPQYKRTICGILDPSSPILLKAFPERDYVAINRFWNQVDWISRAANEDVFHLLQAILVRKTTCEVDKIAALAHLVTKKSPLALAYDPGEGAEQAWQRLLKVMDPNPKAQLRLMSSTVPFQAEGEYPTWKEITLMILPRCHNWLMLHGSRGAVNNLIFDRWKFQWDKEKLSGNRRHGLLTLPDGREFQVDVQEVGHLADGTYTAALPLYFDLLPSSSTSSDWHDAVYITNFVIGHYHDNRTFTRVAVIEVLQGLLVDADPSSNWLLGTLERRTRCLDSNMYPGPYNIEAGDEIDVGRLIRPSQQSKRLLTFT